MIAPPVVTPESDEQFKGIKYNKKISCQIGSNNKNFNLTISNNESIIFFQVEEIDCFPKQDFNLHLNLEQMQKINKFFLQFDSLNEISDSLKKLTESKSIKIDKKEKEKEIILTIINPINLKEFNMSIPLKEKDIKAEITSLNEYVFHLNEKIDNLTQKVNYLENKIKDYETKVEEIYAIKEEYKNLKKKEIIDNSFMFGKSSIIKKEDQDIILGWLEKKPKNFELLLDSKVDGDSTSTFYDKCGKKSPTIVFIETTNGYRFGGYTSNFWPPGDKSSNYEKDENSFLFSLDLKKKYKCIVKNRAIYLNKNNYFSFGDNIYIYNNCTKIESNYLSIAYSYDIPKNYGLNGGKNNFIVKSYEVYQVEY